MKQLSESYARTGCPWLYSMLLWVSVRKMLINSGKSSYARTPTNDVNTTTDRVSVRKRNQGSEEGCKVGVVSQHDRSSSPQAYTSEALHDPPS